jgi:hypothetical protein
MLWLYGQDWFLDVSLFGADMRELFQVRAFNLSVAVWIGFLALSASPATTVSSYPHTSTKGSRKKIRLLVRP